MKRPERVADDHIVEAIERAVSYVHELDSVEAFEEDHKTQAAVIRCIEIIGEAANRIHKQDQEFMTNHPEVPWDKMRGMRNRMIHNYFDVNTTVLWNTVVEDLPRLKQQVEALLKRN